MVEFTLGRGNPFGVLTTVFLTKQTDIDIATLDFFQVQVVRTTVRCWNVLEQKQIEESPKQGVAAEEVAER